MSQGSERNSSTANLLSPMMKRKRTGIWMKFNEVSKDGVFFLCCTACVQQYKRDTDTVTTLKYHWENKHGVDEASCDVDQTLFSGISLTRAEKINHALARVLAVPSMSINSLLHPAMRTFIDVISKDFKLPKSHNTLKTRLCNLFEAKRNLMRQRFETIKIKPSITADIWADASFRNVYLGVTLHYVCDGTLGKAFLGLVSLYGFSHTADVVLSLVNKQLDDYGLDLSKVFKVVTDNGSNMVAAFTDVLQLPNEFSDGLEGENEEDESYGFDNFLEPPNESILLSTFPKRIACFAHSLQLVLMDLFKESIFKALCKIMRKFKHSQQATEELSNASKKSLLFPSFTRWGSVVQVIERFLEIKEFVCQIAGKKGWVYPTEEQMEYLRQIAKLCHPFAESLKRIQGEKFVTISLPLDQCQEIGDEAPMNDKGSSDMLDIFIARLNTEARGKRRRIEGRISRTKAWIMNILRVVQGAGGSGGSSIDPIKYWYRYLSSDWHSFAVLALEILSIPASSAPIERIFSQAGLATKGIRNRTDFNLLNAQLVVYCNDSVC